NALLSRSHVACASIREDCIVASRLKHFTTASLVEDWTMQLLQITCPTCGERAIGMLETVLGVALLVIGEGGIADYLGETKLDWNSQETVDGGDGAVVLTCQNGHEWPSQKID